MTNHIILSDRSIIEIKGIDRKSFLQGLLTNDINKISDGSLIYSAMLNAQGRFLYDFFLFEKNDTIFIDCLKSRRDEIYNKFRFYKLRAQIEIAKNDDYEILQDIQNLQNGADIDSKGGFVFGDPRHKNLGQRIYRKIFVQDSHLSNDQSPYHYQRITLKIPESEHDLTYEKSIIAEFGFDDLNAVDYKKGCYIGQELTARTHYMGQVRKKIFHVTINNSQEIAKNSEISCEGKNNGIILSSVFYEDALHALALIKINEGEEAQEYSVLDNKITIIS